LSSLVVIGGSARLSPVRRATRLCVVGGTASTPPDFALKVNTRHRHAGGGGWLKNMVPRLTRGLLGRVIVPDLAWVWGVVAIAFFIGLVMNHRSTGKSGPVPKSWPPAHQRVFMGLLVLLLSGPILAIIAASIVGLAVVPFAIAALIVAGLMGRIAVARRSVPA
jgi:hypothetical protein